MIKKISKDLVVIKKGCIFAVAFSYRSPDRGRVAGATLWKGRLPNACLLLFVISQITINCKRTRQRWMSTVGILYPAVFCRMYIIDICKTLSRWGLLYTSCVGFCVVQSLQLGQCESLEQWDGQQARFPRILFIEARTITKNLPILGNSIGEWIWRNRV